MSFSKRTMDFIVILAAALLIATSLHSGEHALPPLPDSVKTVDDCIRLLDGLPAPDTSEGRADIERRMRLLQPLSTRMLRRVFDRMSHRYEDSCELWKGAMGKTGVLTLEQFMRKYPVPWDRPAGVSDRQFLSVLMVYSDETESRAEIWIDRFLFEAPDADKRFYCFHMVAFGSPRTIQDVQIDRLYPVVVEDGSPKIVEHGQFLGDEGGGGWEGAEFKDYSRRFRRRPKWWH